MIRVICDVCGRGIPKGKKPKAKANGFDIIAYGTKIDMCAECREALYKWAITRKAERNISDTEGVLDRIVKHESEDNE